MSQKKILQSKRKNPITAIKKIVMMNLFVLCSMILSACGNKQVASDYMDKVELLEQKQLPTLKEIKELEEEYNNLTPKQKEFVTNYGSVEKFLDMDLDGLNELQEDINNAINSGQVAYAEIMDIEKRYEEFSSSEKEYIVDIDKLEKFKALNEYEKAAVVATRYLKNALKNSSSLELEEINVKKEGNYYVKINYSATNGFGARKDDVACLDVSTSFKIGIIGLSSLMGNFEEASNTCLGGYLGFKCEEVAVDCDKILDNLNKEF